MSSGEAAQACRAGRDDARIVHRILHAAGVGRSKAVLGLLIIGGLLIVSALISVWGQHRANLGQALVSAAGAGDAVHVRRLLAQGADPNSREESLDAPNITVSKYVRSIKRVFTGHRASGSPGFATGSTALCLASEKGSRSSVAALLDAGADPNLGMPELPVEAAFRGKHPDIVSLLVARGARFPKRIEGVTPLAAAVASGDASMIRCALRYAGYHYNPYTGANAMEFAVATGDQALLTDMLAHGWDINNPRWQLLGSARSVQMAEFCLSRGLEIRDAWDWYNVLGAWCARTIPGRKVLVAYALPHLAAKYPWTTTNLLATLVTATRSAADRGLLTTPPADDTYPTLQILVEHGASIANINELFDNAIAYNNVEAARCLIDHGANLNHRDLNDNTPLMDSIRSDGATPMISLLLSRGANPNARDKSGLTALWYAREAHYVADPDYKRTIVTLIAHGAHM